MWNNAAYLMSVGNSRMTLVIFKQNKKISSVFSAFKRTLSIVSLLKEFRLINIESENKNKIKRMFMQEEIAKRKKKYHESAE